MPKLSQDSTGQAPSDERQLDAFCVGGSSPPTCSRGHKGQRGQRCKVRLGDRRKGAECRELIEEQPGATECRGCGRGIYVERVCSFCGDNGQPIRKLPANRLLVGDVARAMHPARVLTSRNFELAFEATRPHQTTMHGLYSAGPTTVLVDAAGAPIIRTSELAGQLVQKAISYGKSIASDQGKCAVSQPVSGVTRPRFGRPRRWKSEAERLRAYRRQQARKLAS